MGSNHASKPPIWSIAGIDFRNLLWAAIALGVMVVAIAMEDGWLLRFVHIASGVLLTGADILLGFLIGPIIRRLDFAVQRALSLRLLPKTLFIMTTLGIIAPTSGWFLAVELGFLDLDYPEFWWVVAALAIAAVLAMQGLAVLLPVNIRAYMEMRKDQPDPARIGRIMRLYFVTISSQGVMQVRMVIVMTRFAAGI